MGILADLFWQRRTLDGKCSLHGRVLTDDNQCRDCTRLERRGLSEYKRPRRGPPPAPPPRRVRV